jgi:hypothetical protein
MEAAIVVQSCRLRHRDDFFGWCVVLCPSCARNSNVCRPGRSLCKQRRCMSRAPQDRECNLARRGGVRTNSLQQEIHPGSDISERTVPRSRITAPCAHGTPLAHDMHAWRVTAPPYSPSLPDRWSELLSNNAASTAKHACRSQLQLPHTYPYILIDIMVVEPLFITKQTNKQTGRPSHQQPTCGPGRTKRRAFVRTCARPCRRAPCDRSGAS